VQPRRDDCFNEFRDLKTRMHRDGENKSSEPKSEPLRSPGPYFKEKVNTYTIQYTEYNSVFICLGETTVSLLQLHVVEYKCRVAARFKGKT
jgi:hypothetical protein